MTTTEKLDQVLPAGWVPLADLAAALGVHVATAFRWAGQGVRGTRLSTTKIGGRTGVTPADLRRFLDALNPRAGSPLELPQATAQDTGSPKGDDGRA